MEIALFFKSHIKGYTRKDGTFVPAHDNKVHKQGQKPPVAQFDHKAPLPPEAYSRVGKPDSSPVSDAIGEAMAKLKQVMAGGPKPASPPKVVGSQYGGQTPGQFKDEGSAPKKKWQNSLHGGGTSKPGTTPYSSKQPSLWSGHAKKYDEDGKEVPSYPNAVNHPKMHDDGKPFQINNPDQPSAPDTWTDPDAVAVFTPGSAVPAELNGVPFAEWTDVPTNEAGWHFVGGQNGNLEEPDFDAKGKKPAAGVIIEEPDGRIWLLKPTNAFGGYRSTFPKGRIDHGMSMQASAIKEAFEETGLRVAITGYLDDVVRTQTTTRYYTAKRVGGTPKDMGWEAQAVQLVPKAELHKILNRDVDRDIAASYGVPKPSSE